MSSARPFVTLAYAQTIDGSLAAVRGRPLPISGDASLTLTHRLRAQHDAILIGIGTLLADNPHLTVRRVAGRDPQPIVLDSTLRCPPAARIVARGAWLATTAAAPTAARAALVAAGARVVELPTDNDGRVALSALLAQLAADGIRTLMVEGGAQVLTAFLQAELADRVVVTIAPLFVGGVRMPQQPLPLTRLHDVQIEQLDGDVIFSGRPQRVPQ